MMSKNRGIAGGSDVVLPSEFALQLVQAFSDIEAYEEAFRRNIEADEREMQLVDVIEQMRLRWVDAMNDAKRQSEEVKRLNRELERLKSHCDAVEEELKQSKAQVAYQSSKIQSVEVDLAAANRKIDLGRELIKDETPQLLSSTSYSYRNRSSNKKNSSRFNDLTIDYDVTGDSLEDDDIVDPVPMTAQKRSRSRNAMEIVVEENDENENEVPSKRSRDFSDTPKSALITRETPRKTIPIRRSLNRSFSESNILETKELIQREVKSELRRQMKTPSSTEIRSPRVPALGPSWTNGLPIEKRQHFAVPLTRVMFSEYCDVCNQKLNSGIFKSKTVKNFKCSDCNIRFHDRCRHKAPLPCVPRSLSTPKTPSKQRPKLRDFCPSSRPMIPGLLIHCVIGLEKDRLNTEGIYRVPGQESSVVKLLETLKQGRSVPKFHLEDTETIASCVKRFLSSLNDALIPVSSYSDFLRATEEQNPSLMHSAIMELPLTNRDTLAYLCVHLQKVAQSSQINQMPLLNLSRCFGPTVVGVSHLARPANFTDGIDSSQKQNAIMLALLQLPKEYWNQFIDSSCYNGLSASIISPTSNYR
ncbi:hypothetical protein L596_022977 [Steinernema carpocapsae]|uniref:Rho-GAP domain-containing protein n=1 Tax=Steinernema carpocapsae TaxID=34508 RepID=A0A4U5MC71_STECR|nr:hypothetical protein L596_022977 [Steinernema carpocapsae]